MASPNEFGGAEKNKSNLRLPSREVAFNASSPAQGLRLARIRSKSVVLKSQAKFDEVTIPPALQASYLPGARNPIMYVNEVTGPITKRPPVATRKAEPFGAVA